MDIYFILWIIVHYYNYLIFVLLFKLSCVGYWGLSELGSFVLMPLPHVPIILWALPNFLAPQEGPALYYICREN